RLFLIGDLKRKYGESVPAILEYATDAQRRLDEIEHRTERLGELEAREEQTRSQLSAAAVALSNARRAAADELAREVERELTDLRLSGAHFGAMLRQSDDPNGIPFVGRCVAVDLSGADQVEFVIAANPGEEPRPMTRVASGGEL